MAERDLVVDVRGLKKYFRVRQTLFSKGYDSPWLKAVNGVSFQVSPGGTLGIAGESGCGKTTTGRMLLKLENPTEGEYRFNGRDVTHVKRRELRQFRRQAQMVFQNPFEALNPRFTVYRSLLEPLLIHGIGSRPEQEQRINAAMERVGLKPPNTYYEKFPHQLSGGQLQRIVLARALIVDPIFIVADEPVSMLDVSVRAGVLNLMQEITASMQLATLYISHDLSLIQYLCDDTAIMYLGQIVEMGSTDAVLASPEHPYTQALVAAIPVLDPETEPPEVKIKGSVLSPIDLPEGCLFQNRCPYAERICRSEEPPLESKQSGRSVRCHVVN